MVWPTTGTKPVVLVEHDAIDRNLLTASAVDYIITMFPGSSVVEQQTVNLLVGSSSLPRGAKLNGALADRLRQQFAKLSFRNGRVGSIPTCSAKLTIKETHCGKK